MRVIAYDTARLTLLFPFEEVAPLIGADAFEIISKIKQRYDFKKVPDLGAVTKEDVDKNGLRFEVGRLGNEAVVTDFAIYSDGVVINARTTEDAQLFWTDLLEWMIAQNNFRRFIEPPSVRYISQIVVEFDKALGNLLHSHRAIMSLISAKLSEIYDTRLSVNLARIDFEYDKVAEKSALVVPKFIIERRQGISFERERYFCSAPMRTRDHVDILEKIEKNLD